MGDTAVEPARKRKSWVWVVPALLVAGGLSWLALGSGGGEPDPHDGNPQSHVQTACESAVKAKLKAPGSASFHAGATESKPRIWRVVGDVDATNSFGGSVRTGFSCTVVWHEDETAEVVGVNIPG